MGCIYLVENTISGRRYVGKTVHSMERRRRIHERDARVGSVFAFHVAIRKHGPDSFKWRVIYKSDCEDDLNEMEKDCIVVYRTRSPAGYNMTDGGDGVLTGPMPEGHKQKISKALRGKPKTAEHNAAVSKALTGKKLSEAHVASLKAAERPKQTEESNQKRRQTQSGRPLSKTHRQNMLRGTRAGKPGTLKGRTYDEIYGDRADEYRALRRAKRNRVP